MLINSIMDSIILFLYKYFLSCLSSFSLFVAIITYIEKRYTHKKKNIIKVLPMRLFIPGILSINNIDIAHKMAHITFNRLVITIYEYIFVSMVLMCSFLK